MEKEVKEKRDKYQDSLQKNNSIITAREAALTSIDSCSTLVKPARSIAIFSINDPTTASHDVILPLQEHRALCKSREHEHRAEKMQFFLCCNALFFKLIIFICYNVNVLYSYIFEIQLHNKTKKIEFFTESAFF